MMWHWGPRKNNWSEEDLMWCIHSLCLWVFWIINRFSRLPLLFCCYFEGQHWVISYLILSHRVQVDLGVSVFIPEAATCALIRKKTDDEINCHPYTKEVNGISCILLVLETVFIGRSPWSLQNLWSDIWRIVPVKAQCFGHGPKYLRTCPPGLH